MPVGSCPATSQKPNAKNTFNITSTFGRLCNNTEMLFLHHLHVQDYSGDNKPM